MKTYQVTLNIDDIEWLINREVKEKLYREKVEVIEQISKLVGCEQDKYLKDYDKLLKHIKELMECNTKATEY